MIILDNKRHVKTYSHNDVHSAKMRKPSAERLMAFFMRIVFWGKDLKMLAPQGFG